MTSMISFPWAVAGVKVATLIESSLTLQASSEARITTFTRYSQRKIAIYTILMAQYCRVGIVTLKQSKE
jgi:hypothetical protein